MREYTGRDKAMRKPYGSVASNTEIIAADRFLVWFGTKCSSWSICARGSTLRSYLNALGNENLQSVRDANTMVGRCSLLMGLICARGGSWLLEQPEHSLMARHPRFRQLCRRQTVSR